jgi:predicted amino acid-binding ACT domain protein
MPEFAATAIGRDRPGIVAAISEALLALQGNIEDSLFSAAVQPISVGSENPR